MSQLAREKCGCGAEIELQGIIGVGEMLAEWRADHMCKLRARPTTPEGVNGPTNDWREKFVGQLCGVCSSSMNSAKELTTLNSQPLHVSCRKQDCVICGKKQSGIMQWPKAEQVPQNIPYGLAHEKCLNGPSQ